MKLWFYEANIKKTFCSILMLHQMESKIKISYLLIFWNGATNKGIKEAKLK